MRERKLNSRRKKPCCGRDRKKLMRKDKRKLKTRKNDEFSSYWARRCWTEVRVNALKEAGGKCMVCDKDSGKLDTHHILPRSFYPNFIYCPENLIILCSSCHKWSKNSFHKNPFVAVMWLFRNLPKKFYWCERHKNNFPEEGYRMNHKAEYAKLFEEKE